MLDLFAFSKDTSSATDRLPAVPDSTLCSLGSRGPSGGYCELGELCRVPVTSYRQTLFSGLREVGAFSTLPYTRKVIVSLSEEVRKPK